MKNYLHGFSRREQNRLYEQARMLEPWVYRDIDFISQKKILEIGCGVGAQTGILLRRFPHLHITGVDAAAVQLRRAREHLKAEIRKGRVRLLHEDASKMSFPNDTFDGAFVCWLLEHVPDPVRILREAHRVLKSGSVLYCTEVNNSSLFVHPYSPATLQYWFAFNDHQWNIRGDPFVGCKLGNLMTLAGFQDIRTEVISFHLDSRKPKLRSQFMDYWIQLLLSGAPSLLKAKKTDLKTVNEMRRELEKIKTEPDAVFFYSCIQARGYVY